MSDIEEQVKNIVVEHLGIEESKVTPEAKFHPDPSYSSSLVPSITTGKLL